ncbi:hypothetical protein ABVK25_005437 [Lepraria finkii]|uniref:Uncharacterized protein n=1 Tax=Lepraria finkii TaxID=1340010 RepID=A0ABR4B8W0_9LECA
MHPSTTITTCRASCSSFHQYMYVSVCKVDQRPGWFLARPATLRPELQALLAIKVLQSPPGGWLVGDADLQTKRGGAPKSFQPAFQLNDFPQKTNNSRRLPLIAGCFLVLVWQLHLLI